MPPRFHCNIPFETLLYSFENNAELELPSGASRHIQVLRLQPQQEITLFTGGENDGQWLAQIIKITRSSVYVLLLEHKTDQQNLNNDATNRLGLHLLAAVVANERMDWLVEKATELGVSSITPIMSERGTVKLKGERSEKKRQHWEAVAIAACEQCGRNRVPVIHAPVSLAQWLSLNPDKDIDKSDNETRVVLSLAEGSRHFREIGKIAEKLPQKKTQNLIFLSGAEGGLTSEEEAQALAHGFLPMSLGRYTLRAETAPVAALAMMEALFS